MGGCFHGNGCILTWRASLWVVLRGFTRTKEDQEPPNMLSCYTGRKKSGNGLPLVGRVQVRVATSPRRWQRVLGSLVSVPVTGLGEAAGGRAGR